MKLTLSDLGFTLVELLICLTIAALLFAAALPATQDWVSSHQRRTAAHDLLAFFAYSRQQAIQHGNIITVCPLDDTGACGRDWNTEISMFTDPFNSRKLAQEQRPLRILPPPKYGSLRVRSLSSSYFQYRPDGRMHSNLGNVTWCPDSGDRQKAAHLIISRGGRIRLSKDHDNDGIPERSDGSPVEC